MELILKYIKVYSVLMKIPIILIKILMKIIVNKYNLIQSLPLKIIMIYLFTYSFYNHSSL